MNGPVSDITMVTLQQALRGIDARRQATQDNIANSETPGYLANSVDFESSLRRALDGGQPSNMSISTSRSMAATNIQGNNVSLDKEMVTLTENQLRQQLVIEALNAKFRLLRSAITGQ
jgi:flagellar basal-body rod protein FlgB